MPFCSISFYTFIQSWDKMIKKIAQKENELKLYFALNENIIGAPKM